MQSALREKHYLHVHRTSNSLSIKAAGLTTVMIDLNNASRGHDI